MIGLIDQWQSISQFILQFIRQFICTKLHVYHTKNYLQILSITKLLKGFLIMKELCCVSRLIAAFSPTNPFSRTAWPASFRIFRVDC